MDTTVITQQIPRQHWADALRDVADLYRGWRISIEVLRMDMGDQWVLEGLPLIALYIREHGPDAGSIVIEAGDPSRRMVVHYVLRPVGLTLAITDAGGEGDVEIVSEDGTVTLVRLHHPLGLPPGGTAQEGTMPARGRRSLEGEHESWDRGPQADEMPATAFAPTPVGAGSTPFRRTNRMAGAIAGGPRVVSPPRGPRGGRRREAGVAPAWTPGVDVRPSAWPYILRGVAAVAFGILALSVPGLALLTMVILFGAYAITDGIFDLSAAFSPGDAGPRQPRGVLVVKGIISLAAGAVALLVPGLTALALLYVIAAWAIATGVMEIVAAIRLRRQLAGEWLVALGGVLAIAAGVLMIVYPGAGAIALSVWIAAFAIVFGVIQLSHGLTLSDRLRAGAPAPATAAVYGGQRA